MKIKKHIYNVLVDYIDPNGTKLGTCFQIRGKSVSKSQAKEMAEILYPNVVTATLVSEK